MRIRSLYILLLLTAYCLPTIAQTQHTDSLQKASAAELSRSLQQYFSGYNVSGYRPSQTMKADSFRVDDKAQTLSVYLSDAFLGQKLTTQRVDEIRDGILMQLPAPYNTYDVLLFSSKRKTTFETLIPNYARTTDIDDTRRWGSLAYDGRPWVENASLPYSVTQGLAGRHIMLWPSHGRYWKETKWEWQRPILFCTTEDLYTQSFVNPFLLPMLEKAGAVAYSARERDYQTAEVVVDNDSPTLNGTYTEQGTSHHPWTDADSTLAFGLPEGTLTDGTQPFRMGTARQAETTTDADSATITWRPAIPAAGRYAVYVSYVTLPGSVDDAHYTVYHKGGVTHFRVNQQMGDRTWVYLGTFAFDAGENSTGRVTLSNRSSKNGVVTADAVRFGGGMGQTVRSGGTTSGLPRFLEAARYQAQWCGIPDSLYDAPDGNNDYQDDIRCRSNMLNYLSGGSVYMPAETGLKIPFEASLAFHSDAGARKDNTPYGTLAICTTVDGKGGTTYPSGISRMASSDFASFLLDNVTNDLSATFGFTWPRRELWDRNYGETRSPNVPAVILESMSHQNFCDMRYGHDPLFKFVFARAVYKSLLRFIPSQHGTEKYVVAPLPVHNFSAILAPTGTTVRLSWSPTKDSIESSATPTHYILYTKKGDGDFDNGKDIGNYTSHTLTVEPDVQYSFRITAVNDGGESFPSETLSVYKSLNSKGHILIINGFTRLSGPALIDTPDSLGFDLNEDIGVPYINTAAFAGYQTCFDRNAAGKEGVGALGYGNSALTGRVIAGNTFDYTVVHGKAIRGTGKYSFSSCSKEAAKDISWTSYNAIDYITGLEKDAPYNLRPYKTFDTTIMNKMREYTRSGGNILVSGAYIASDMQDSVEQQFTADVLKYEADSVERSKDYMITGLKLSIPIQREFSSEQYAVQVSDGIAPADDKAFPAFAYASGRPAGIAYKGKDYRVIAMGFPFESINDQGIRLKAMSAILRFLINKK